jgi:hypothetical protein
LFAVPAGSVLTLALSGRIADAFGGVRVMRVAGDRLASRFGPVRLVRASGQYGPADAVRTGCSPAARHACAHSPG